MDSLGKSKSVLRKIIKQTAGKYSEEELRKRSNLISENVVKSKWWDDAKAIFAYLSFGKEFITEILIRKALDRGKVVAVPRIEGRQILFHRIYSLRDEFLRNSYGILEPSGNSPLIAPCSYQFSLVIVPGLAFDRQCRRLGRGKGFYDRYIEQVRKECRGKGEKVIFIAPAFSFQMVDEVPAGRSDRKVDAVVTETDVIEYP